MKYKVTIDFIGSYVVEVDASESETPEEKAMKMFDNAFPPTSDSWISEAYPAIIANETGSILKVSGKGALRRIPNKTCLY